MAVIIFIIILAVVIFVHELGHFLTAKKAGIRVDEFGFGFPPRLFGIRRGETLYSLNAIPFGGFVKIYGETPDAETLAGPDSKRSLIAKPRGVQALVMVAGVVFNVLLAWFLLSIGFMSGLPSSVSVIPVGSKATDVHLVIVDIGKGTPAETAGLKVGDSISSITSGEDVLNSPTPEDVQHFVPEHVGQDITINYNRGPDAGTVQVTPQVLANGTTPIIGISLDLIGRLRLGFFKAFAEGGRLTISLLEQTVAGLWHLLVGAFTGTANLSEVSGPVGIASIVGQAYKFGFVYLLSFTALISINLAVINLIPFPALDGGRILFLAIEAIMRRPINPKITNRLNTIGFVLLVLLMLFVTYHDIVKLLK